MHRTARGVLLCALVLYSRHTAMKKNNPRIRYGQKRRRAIG